MRILVEAALRLFTRKPPVQFVEEVKPAELEFHEMPIVEVVAALTAEEIKGLKIDQLQEELKRRLQLGFKWEDIEPIVIQGLRPAYGPDRAVKKAQKIKARLGLSD